MATDSAFNINVPMRLAKKYGASIYAGFREYAPGNHRACVVYVLEQLQFCEVAGIRGEARRIEASPLLKRNSVGRPIPYITPDHFLGPVLPVGRKVTKPTSLLIADSALLMTLKDRIDTCSLRRALSVYCIVILPNLREQTNLSVRALEYP